MKNEAEYKELINIIRLIRTKNIGAITFANLINHYGSVQSAIDALPSLYKGKDKWSIAPLSVAEKEIETAIKNNIEIIPFTSEDYPPLLKFTEDYPPIIFVKGHKKLLKKSAIAIVGSRNCSISGKQNAHNFAQELGKNGFLVVSGMAKGIDAAAHKGSLQKGTIAFLGGGVDIIYPKENAILYEDIAEHGLLASDFPIGLAPIASNFPRRNRLIAGVSRGVLVVEASLSSGSMITAQIAADIGRDVFAIPSNPADGISGTNALIKDGAFLTENIDDILNVLKNKPNISNFTLKEENHLTNVNFASKNLILEEKILEEVRNVLNTSLNSSPLSVDNIIRMTEFPRQYVLQVLLELEITGKLERFPGNKVALVKPIKL
jgi:DNA processing protein